jgi:hypothetical protein
MIFSYDFLKFCLFTHLGVTLGIDEDGWECGTMKHYFRLVLPFLIDEKVYYTNAWSCCYCLRAYTHVPDSCIYPIWVFHC